MSLHSVPVVREDVSRATLRSVATIGPMRQLPHQRLCIRCAVRRLLCAQTLLSADAERLLKSNAELIKEWMEALRAKQAGDSSVETQKRIERCGGVVSTQRPQATTARISHSCAFRALVFRLIAPPSSAWLQRCPSTRPSLPFNLPASCKTRCRTQCWTRQG